MSVFRPLGRMVTNVMSVFRPLGRMVTEQAKAAWDRLHGQCRRTAFGLILLPRAALRFPAVFAKRREIMQQLYNCGVKSLAVTMVVVFFTGFILAFQTGIVLKDFGAQDQVGQLVVVAMFREMGPFITGLILAATVGSAMAAELGTMTISQEIDALELMSIDPIKFLVMPRILAMAIIGPVMTIFANYIAIIGGAIIAYNSFGVPFDKFYQLGRDSLAAQERYFFMPKDMFVGYFKAFIFGLIISTVGCSQGLLTSGGALGVGRATRAAVVYSFVLIIIIGYYITYFFYS
ncbi:MAG: ABC transporter permease [Planctomycetota bacterium]